MVSSNKANARSAKGAYNPTMYRHHRHMLARQSHNFDLEELLEQPGLWGHGSSPFGLVISVGHVDELPVQNSDVSHLSSLDCLHNCVFGASWQLLVQQVEPLGSHTAPAVNLQVCESQHVELLPKPGSQSSPASTMPLPHICVEIT